jgi:hypothetical protein
MTKEETVKEIISYPLSYALFRDALKDGKWDEEKLKYMDIGVLKDYLRDIKTLERNKERIKNGEYN